MSPVRGGGCLQVDLAGVGPPEADVVGDGPVQHPRVLGHQRELVAERAQAQAAQVDPVQLDRAGVGVVEPLQQGEQGRLAGAGGADNADPLAGGHLQVQVAQDRGALGVGEPDPAQGQPVAGRAGRDGVGRLGHDLARVEHLEDPLAAGRAPGQGPGQPGQGPDGPVQAGQVGQHHQQRPQGHPAAGHRGHPQPQHQPAPGGQQQVGDRRPARLQVHGGQRRPDGPLAPAGEAAARLPLAGERLHHPDVAQHLGGLAGQGGVGVPGRPLDRADAPRGAAPPPAPAAAPRPARPGRG